MTLQEAWDNSIQPSSDTLAYPWARPVLKGKIVIDIDGNPIRLESILKTNDIFRGKITLKDSRCAYLYLPFDYPCDYEKNKCEFASPELFGFQKRDYSVGLAGTTLYWKHPSVKIEVIDKVVLSVF